MKTTPAILFSLILSAGSCPLFAAEPPPFQWDEQEIDTIEIGYGLQLTDVDGDGKTDIVLADKNTIQWYRNPGWEKHVIASDLTVRDNVCIAARDIDGDGKCEIVVGGQWNFRETLKDGAVTYLIPPGDRTQPWKPVPLSHEPNTHRMHWIAGQDGKFSFVVKPLRGRGSVEGVGPGMKILEYFVPGDPTDRKAWTTRLVSNHLHLSHNFQPVNWDEDPEDELIVAAKEGVWYFDRRDDHWGSLQLTENFAGEIADGRLPGGKRFMVTVEPMHGTSSAVYVEPEGGPVSGAWAQSSVLDDALVDGHALAVADYLDIGSDQIVVGWRAMNHSGPEGQGTTPPSPGIKLFTPLDATGEKWRETVVSGDEVAVEDIKAADLNGDGRADIVAAARQTKNLKIFFSKP